MQIRTVTAITRHIKSLIDQEPDLQDLWIEGEVSNYKQATSGHCYFTLRDQGSELRCVMWRSQAQRLPWSPGQGDLVDAHGHISVYERGGAYQFYVDRIEQSGGMGLRWQQFLELKARLEAEGLFDVERKRALPAWPRRIGIVTSASGAAFRDILNVLGARYPLVEVVLSPSLVQGPKAPAALVRAIERLSRLPDIDVIIVSRGGGSLEDLWAFNDEQVALAIATATHPVVSGVGHETDFTITDFVADVRAPTPSAAAAAVVPDQEELGRQLEAMVVALRALMRERLARWRERLDRAERILRLHNPQHMLGEQRQRVDSLVARAERSVRHRIEREQMNLERQRARLLAANPITILSRGYAIVEDATTGRRLGSVRHAHSQQLLGVRLVDGRLQTRVEKIEPDRRIAE